MSGGGHRAAAAAGPEEADGDGRESAPPGTGRSRPRAPLPVDLLLAGYLALTAGLALASLTPAGAAIAALHGAAVWALLGAASATGGALPRAAPAGEQGAGGGSVFRRRVLPFFRVAYPVILTPLLYTELGHLNQLHVQGYLDPMVQGWEEALFGAQLSVVWAERQPWRWLSELMHLGYASYYVLIPISAVVVYWRGGARELHRFTMITGLGFLLCYLIFVVFPVAGPRYLYDRLQEPPARALFFDAVHAIAEGASSKGTAFPSSHVSATVAGWLACRRRARHWFWISAPFVLLLTLGTVYGRFHYAVDSLAGVAVAAAAWRLGPALSRRLSPGERFPGGGPGAGRDARRG